MATLFTDRLSQGEWVLFFRFAYISVILANPQRSSPIPYFAQAMFSTRLAIGLALFSSLANVQAVSWYTVEWDAP